MKALDIVEKPLHDFDTLYSRAKSVGFVGSMYELFVFLTVGCSLGPLTNCR